MLMEIKKIIGANIRAFREWRGMSQIELAKKSKLHRVYIGAVERGERNISINNITKISTALNIATHILLMEDARTWIK